MLMPAISRYMTREPYMIPPTSTAAMAFELMRVHLIRHLPIVDGNHVVGVVTAAQLQALAAAAGDFDQMSVTKVMTPPVMVWGSESLDKVANIMSEKKCDCVVVLGGHGIQGIFTATDALRALSQILARVAG
jgi:acetoin utilization protein AcuB